MVLALPLTTVGLSPDPAAINPDFITHDDTRDESLVVISHLTELKAHVKTLLTSDHCQELGKKTLQQHDACSNFP